MRKMELKDKVVVVLGASAEGGTGWTIAESFAAEGAKVIVGARRIEPLRELADKIGGLAVACDGGVPQQIKTMAVAARDAYGPIDVAINSAATSALGTIAKASLEDIQKSIDVNYIGHIYFIRHMAEVMRDGGAITIISTLAASKPVLNFFPYACAKAALESLITYAALEYGPRGIRVNSVAPGPIRTPMAAGMFDDPAVDAAYRQQIPLDRVAMAWDIAEAVIRLSEIGYVTGVNLPVSGGMHLNRIPPTAAP